MTDLTRDQRKQLLRQRGDDAEIASELSRERRIEDDVHWRGVGEVLAKATSGMPAR